MNSIVLMLVLILLFLNWRATRKGWRESFLFAVLTWNVILVATTEILSAFHLITYHFVLASWLAVGLVCLLVVYRNRKSVLSSLQRAESLNQKMSLGLESWIIAGLVLVTLLIGLAGVVYEPNSVDSYHLSRIMHWIQNHNVDHYPTGDLRQLFLSPGSEFAMMHILLLSGNDKLASLVQWFSMLGSAICSSMIAQQLGANRKEQLFAGAISLTIPVGILEASGTLNDYVVSFWVLCCVFFLLNLLANGNSLINTFGFGASLGLAVLAKSVAIVYVAPFLTWMLLSYVLTRQRKIVSVMLWAGVISLSMNIGHFTRNLLASGNPLGAPTVSRYFLNEIHSPQAILSNLIRNVSLHLNTPFERVDGVTEELVAKLHKVIQIDVNDPRITETDAPWLKFNLSTPIRQEQAAGNLLHLVLIVFAIMIFSIGKGTVFDSNNRRFMTAHLFATLGAFLLLSMVFKFTSQNGRYQLPFFLLFSPFVAVTIDRAFRPLMTNSIMVVLLVFSLPWVLFNQDRPVVSERPVRDLVYSFLHKVDNSSYGAEAGVSEKVSYDMLSSPNDQIFRELRRVQMPMIQATNYLGTLSCREFGLYSGGKLFEYPLWILLENQFGNSFRLESVLVTNESREIVQDRSNLNPCAVVSLTPETGASLVINGVHFNQTFISSNIIATDCCSVSVYTK